MSIHNICLYKEVKKKYTGCNLKTTEFLDCALIGVRAVIRSNMVYYCMFLLLFFFFLILVCLNLLISLSHPSIFLGGFLILK